MNPWILGYLGIGVRVRVRVRDLAVDEVWTFLFEGVVIEACFGEGAVPDLQLGSG